LRSTAATSDVAAATNGVEPLVPPTVCSLELMTSGQPGTMSASGAGAEFRVAIAGPLVTLLLGLVFLALAAMVQTSDALHGVLAWLGYINLFLLGFNLIPALPLDGGRVLRAALWKAKGNLGSATTIAAGIGRGVASLLIAGGVVLFIFLGAFTGVWFCLIGWFLLNAGEAERQHVRTRQALAGLRVGDLMVRSPLTARADQTIAAFMDETAGMTRHALYPVVRDGELVGVLPFGRIANVPRDEWPRRAVRECMLPPDELPALSEDDDLADVLVQVGEANRRRAVVLRDGRLVGLLSVTDITRLLAERAPRSSGSPAEPRSTAPHTRRSLT
jgi:Zn-dependent protease